MDERSVDQELVVRTLAGDSEAYRALVEKYQNRVFALAFEILKIREDAEDVAQESLVKAYFSLKDFKAESSFYTWLYRIAYNMAIDYKRKASRRGEQPSFVEEQIEDDGGGKLASHFENPHEAFYHKEQARRIQEALGEISEEHRAVIMLREVEGLSYDEIARVVGISKGTVMSRLHYARKRLQVALAEFGTGGISDAPSNGAAVESSLSIEPEMTRRS